MSDVAKPKQTTANDLKLKKQQLENKLHDLLTEFCKENELEYFDLVSIQLKASTVQQYQTLDVKVKINI